MKYFRKVQFSIIALLLLASGISGLRAQVAKGPTVKAKFGKGVRIHAADNSFYFKFEARFQALFQGNYDLRAQHEAFDGEMMIRRARLKFSGFAFKPGIEYKIELGLSNRDLQVKGKSSDYANIVLDAYLRMKLYQNLKVRIGQFKLPGNRERIISSGSLQFVDRSIINSKFNLDRDSGIMLENKTSLGDVVLRQYAAISSGEGRNRLGADAGFSYSGRLEVLPLGEFSKKGDFIEGAIYREETPKISFGFSGSINDMAQRSRGQLGDWLPESRTIRSLEADVIFKYQGFSAQGEVALRDVKNPVINVEMPPKVSYFYKGSGWNAQIGYLFKNNWEVATRVSDLRPHLEISALTDRQTDFTVAVSKYLVGHKLKFQGDVTYSKKSPSVTYRFGGEKVIVRFSSNFNF